jgi:hypothetical protein
MLAAEHLTYASYRLGLSPGASRTGSSRVGAGRQPRDCPSPRTPARGRPGLPGGVGGFWGAGSGGCMPRGGPAPASPARTAPCACLLLPGRAVCSALGTGGRWMPWHAARPPGASGEANEVGHGSGCRVGSARVPGWLAALAAGVGHARNRPARSLHPGRDGRTRLRPRELLAARSRHTT